MLPPALQVEVREPLGCRHERSKACRCWALSRRSQTLLSQIPNLARRTGRSRGRKSLKCRVVCAQVPGRAGAQGAPVITILPGNENERAGSGFHSRPRGLGGGQGQLLQAGAPERCGSAVRRRFCSHPPAAGGQPLKQSGPGAQGDEGGIRRIWGAEGNPVPGLGTTDQLYVALVLLRKMGGGCPCCGPGPSASPR